MTTIIGIDLGTTNSLVSIWRNGAPVLIPNALGEYLTPSCVGLDNDGAILVGAAARERLQTHPERTAAVFKRYMGSNHTVRLGSTDYRAEELSSFVLRSLKADAEAFLGRPVDEAIITVPAYFSDGQRKATRAAGQLAGLRVERLLNEPTAAALAYGIQDLGREAKFLVFDLGGGTFDVSILELFEGVMEVRASAGDNFLGGEDFVSILCDEFVRINRIKFPPEGSTAARDVTRRLRDQGERVKRELTRNTEATMRCTFGDQSYEWTITEEAFARLAEPLLVRLRQPVERAMRDSRISVADLNNVVLAGGSTRMPIVRKLVSRMFGRLPAATINPDEVVALGAAVQVGLKMRDAALNEVVMTDVAPYSLGISVSRELAPGQLSPGHYLPIIDRNSVVPVSRMDRVQTLRDGQREIVVQIYQGESRLVKDNIHLGELRLEVPPKPAGEVILDVRFTYDVNGLLEVEVIIANTGQRHSLIIAEAPGVLSQEEIARRFAALAELKIHPRDQTQNRAIMARAERVYEQSLGDVRNFVAQRIMEFQALLDQQKLDDIERARPLFKELLDRIEGDTLLG